MINILMLIEAGVLDESILYLSQSISARNKDYYRLLRAVTAEGDAAEWIHGTLDVAHHAATSTIAKISPIRSCQDELGEPARVATTGGGDPQILAVLVEQPDCSMVVERGNVSRQTASAWLHALVDAGHYPGHQNRTGAPRRPPTVPRRPHPARLTSAWHLAGSSGGGWLGQRGDEQAAAPGSRDRIAQDRCHEPDGSSP